MFSKNTTFTTCANYIPEHKEKLKIVPMKTQRNYLDFYIVKAQTVNSL